MKLLLVCLIPFLCIGHGPRHHARTWSNGMPTCDAVHTTNCNIGPQSAVPFKGCADVVKNFHDSWGNQDDFVSEFRAGDQHAVLVCLEAYAKKRGLQ